MKVLWGTISTFDVKGDPNGLFKVVQKEARSYAIRTHRPALDY